MIKRRAAATADTSVAWGVACDMRGSITSARLSKWPLKAMTKEEKKHLETAMTYLQTAEEYVRWTQASLAERSKLAGFDKPDYKRARALN